MFFWKFTRSGKYSSRYISLILDFHNSNLNGNILNTNFEECMDILYLIHDVETLNGLNNFSSGLEKQPFQEQVNKLGYKASKNYNQQRNSLNLVNGQMTLGTHGGAPLDYGLSNKNGKPVSLDVSKLKYTMLIDANTGLIYGTEDKLKAFRANSLFINNGYYFDLMPMHSCIIEIVNKMMLCDSQRTISFLINNLKWEEI